MDRQRTISLSRQHSVMLIEDKQYQSSFVEKLNKIYTDNYSRWCDVTFVVEGEKIKAHKIILASFSDYFRGMFNLEKSDEITIHQVTKEAFQLILNYAYSGKLIISTENAQDVLIAANFYGCVSLMQEIQMFMLPLIDEENALDILDMAETYSLDLLKSKSSEFLAARLPALISNEETRSLLMNSRLEVMEVLLKSDHLMFRCPSSDLILPPEAREIEIAKIIVMFTTTEDKYQHRIKLLEQCLNWYYIDNFKNLINSLNLSEEERLSLVFLEGEMTVQCQYNENLMKGLTCDERHEIINVLSRVSAKRGKESVCTNCKTKDDMFSCVEPRHNWRSCFKCLLKSNAIEENRISLDLSKRFTGLPFDAASHPIATGNEVGRPTESFHMVASPDEYITALTIKTRPWDGREVLRSLELTFSSGRIEEAGGSGIITNTYIVKMNKKEHIVDMRISSGWMIDSFNISIGRLNKSLDLEVSNLSRYGGDGGAERNVNLRPSSDLPEKAFDHCLVGFKGRLVHTQGQNGIMHLSAIWRLMPGAFNSSKIYLPWASRAELSDYLLSRSWGELSWTDTDSNSNDEDSYSD